MPRYPLLYQINTRAHLTNLSRALGRPATLDDLPDSELDRLAILGFNWLYLLGVWQTGPHSRQVARQHPGLHAEYRRALPDVTEEDICGSCFAIASYTVSEELGGNAAILRLRERGRQRGLRVMLDFVPNHTGLDHPWVQEHPEYYLWASEEELQSQPHSYIRIANSPKPLILAHGRDPYFDGWTDTLQLDYANPDLQMAMGKELLSIAGLCDGVRCDMAMLVLPEVFQRTWGLTAQHFWPEAIARVRRRYPDFNFMAEVYWDMETNLQGQGFDYCYDKRLYDYLLAGEALLAKRHFAAPLPHQEKLAHFLENHDEKRAAAEFSPAQHRAAAVLTYTAPGLRFFHEGQLQGWRIKLPVQLCRGPEQPTDPGLAFFYERLMALLRLPALRDGHWQLLEPQPFSPREDTWQKVIAIGWDLLPNESSTRRQRVLVVVNFAPTFGRCHLHLPWKDLARQSWHLNDHFSGEVLQYDGDDLAGQGLYLELPPWDFNGYIIEAAPKAKGRG